MPRPMPILLIHGFNGDPGDWTDGGFRQYLITRGNLEPDLVRLFRYGDAGDGTYNNRGDVRAIAARLAGCGLSADEVLACSVDRLSQDSVGQGGPAGVTLIAHSLGGIISRYYLSRGAPDEFGTCYRGNVSRLLQIASPNRGVEVLRLTRLVPPNSWPWRIIRGLERAGLAPALPVSAVEAWEAALQARQFTERARLVPPMDDPCLRMLLTDSPVYRQLDPDSALLRYLNAQGRMPDAVTCHTFYGDIRVTVRVSLGASTSGAALWQWTASFGDLTVPVPSAAEIPHVAATRHPYVSELECAVSLAGRPSAPFKRSLAEYLPDAYHGNLLANPAVHAGVLAAIL